MKVYHIRRSTFWAIILLILVLPVSRHWRLLSTGERTSGTVGEYASYVHEFRHGEREIREASEIRFHAGDSLVMVYGPVDAQMQSGREVGICYDPDYPMRFCLLTFAGFYSSHYSILPVILLFLWLAFYHSFNRYKKKRNPLIFALITFLLATLLPSCQEEPQYWKVSSDEQVIGDFIIEHPDDFKEFAQLIQLTEMEALLRIRGPYTVFLPTDEAMLEYYQAKGVGSLEELGEEFLSDLVLTHIIPDFIGANDIGLGALPTANGLGDYLSSEFWQSDILISKHSVIIDRDVLAANGLIHIIDYPLDPVSEDIYSVVAMDPSYSLFAEGLRLAGLMDTLQLISFPYGDAEARTRFTVLAVADSIFHRYGIQSMEDMVEWTGAHPDSLDMLESPFFRYFEYHCLNGSYFLSDLNTGIYPILSRDNNILFTIDTDYKINLDKLSGAYTGFHIPASNTAAKNGAVHAVDDILPVSIPEPTTVLFETTHFFDLQHSDYYLKYYKRFFDGENTFAKIKWEGDYLLYYFKPIQSGIIDHDCLSMRGWWSISITFPKIMKGRYEVSIFQPGWNSTTNAKVYVDGEVMPLIFEGPYGGTGGTGGLQKVGEVEFLTTAEHTVTVKCITPGTLFWDYVQFDPIN